MNKKVKSLLMSALIVVGSMSGTLVAKADDSIPKVSDGATNEDLITYQKKR